MLWSELLLNVNFLLVFITQRVPWGMQVPVCVEESGSGRGRCEWLVKELLFFSKVHKDLWGGGKQTEGTIISQRVSAGEFLLAEMMPVTASHSQCQTPG